MNRLEGKVVALEQRQQRDDQSAPNRERFTDDNGNRMIRINCGNSRIVVVPAKEGDEAAWLGLPECKGITTLGTKQ